MQPSIEIRIEAVDLDRLTKRLTFFKPCAQIEGTVGFIRSGAIRHRKPLSLPQSFALRLVLQSTQRSVEGITIQESLVWSITLRLLGLAVLVETTFGFDTEIGSYPSSNGERLCTVRRRGGLL
jgi:hypothetical protein